RQPARARFLDDAPRARPGSAGPWLRSCLRERLERRRARRNPRAGLRAASSHLAPGSGATRQLSSRHRARAALGRGELMASASGWLGLHGFTGAPESLSGLFAADGAWLCPWLAGHGPRPPRAASFVSEVERLEELALRELTPPLGLFGYSLGARLALGL